MAKFMCPNGHRHSKPHLSVYCPKCLDIARAKPIVTKPADDGTRRISAYDTTWPDVATKQPRRGRED